jgi:hypothetical protein
VLFPSEAEAMKMKRLFRYLELIADRAAKQSSKWVFPPILLNFMRMKIGTETAQFDS